MMDRNWHQQDCVNKCGEVGDDAGYLIAAFLSGAGEKVDLVTQAGTLNGGIGKLWKMEYPPTFRVRY